MEQQTDSKLGKEYDKAVYCHPAYLTYMQSTSCEMLGYIRLQIRTKTVLNVSSTKFFWDTSTLILSKETQLAPSTRNTFLFIIIIIIIFF